MDENDDEDSTIKISANDPDRPDLIGQEMIWKPFLTLNAGIEQHRLRQRRNDDNNNGDNRRSILPTFGQIGQFVSSNYFYETIAGFDQEHRLNHFFETLMIGEKFLCKVMNVFERSAEVILIFSARRDISDLRIKAHLRLVINRRDAKTGALKQRHDSRIEVSERIEVEVYRFERSTRKIDVIRSVPDGSDDEDDAVLDDIDDDDVRRGKYRTIKPDEMSFHDYMIDHNDLRNPSLVKLHPWTSLVNSDHVIKCLEHRFANQFKEHLAKMAAPPPEPEIEKPPGSQEPEPVQSGSTTAKRRKSSTSSSDESNHRRRHRRKHHHHHHHRRKHKSKSKHSSNKSNKKQKHKYRHRSSSSSSSRSDSSRSSQPNRSGSSGAVTSNHHHRKDSKKKIDEKILQLLRLTH